MVYYLGPYMNIELSKDFIPKSEILRSQRKAFVSPSRRAAGDMSWRGDHT